MRRGEKRREEKRRDEKRSDDKKSEDKRRGEERRGEERRGMLKYMEVSGKIVIAILGGRRQLSPNKWIEN